MGIVYPDHAELVQQVADLEAENQRLREALGKPMLAGNGPMTLLSHAHDLQGS